MVETAQWANSENTVMHATIDGIDWQWIRMDEQSELQRKVQDWIDAGRVPASYDPAKDPMASLGMAAGQ